MTADLAGLATRAAAVVGDRVGAAVRLKDATAFMGADRPNRLVRVTVESDAAVPATLVIKQTSPDGDWRHPDSLPAKPLLNEWSWLEYLDTLPVDEPLSPRFYGGDADIPFVVMEDIGERRAPVMFRDGSVHQLPTSLVQPLLSGTADEATDGLLKLARALGRLHGASAGGSEDYERVRTRLGGDVGAWQGHRQQLRELVDALPERLAATGVEPGAGVRDELHAAIDAIGTPGPFHACTHNDVCPDNVSLIDGSLRLLDFERASYGHAMLDAVCARIGFGRCWCGHAVPADVVARFEAEHRRTFAKRCAAAGDERLYTGALTDAVVYHALGALLSLPDCLDADRPYARSTVRQRLLHRIETAVATTDAIGAHRQAGMLYRALATRLRERWPETPTMAVYPGFAS